MCRLVGWNMDTYQGDAESPLSLHKYLYVGSSPVDRVDPSGNFGLEEAMVAIAVTLVVLTIFFLLVSSTGNAPGNCEYFAKLEAGLWYLL